MPGVFLNSMPKSGTNLMEAILREFGFTHSGSSVAASTVTGNRSIAKKIIRQSLSQKKNIDVGLSIAAPVSRGWLKRKMSGCKAGTYISGHARYSNDLYAVIQKASLRNFYVSRDPRAVAVSWALYISEKHKKAAFLSPYFEGLDFSASLDRLLSGGIYKGRRFKSFREIYESSIAWRECDEVYHFKFEELVGSRGGGDDRVQLDRLQKISQILKVESASLHAIANNIYGASSTFRTGSIDSWRLKVDMTTKDELDGELSGLY